jgi:hypothetical protein
MTVKIFFISFILLAFIAYAQTPTDAPQLKVTKHGSEVASFKGTGNQTTKSFQLKSGPTTFSALLNWEKNDSELAPGEGKFAVTLQDEQGKTVEQVIATFDHFDGARTVDVAKDGKYQLQVVAPGPWSISVEQ